MKYYSNCLLSLILKKYLFHSHFELEKDYTLPPFNYSSLREKLVPYILIQGLKLQQSLALAKGRVGKIY